jgi:transposase-like protein
MTGDVSPGSKKQAGKVSVGLAMRKELYTSIIEDMPEMNSQDIYSMVLERAARETTPAPKKRNKKRHCESSDYDSD